MESNKTGSFSCFWQDERKQTKASKQGCLSGIIPLASASLEILLQVNMQAAAGSLLGEALSVRI